MSVKQRCVCAVDGGGTKTLAVVMTMQGEEIARAVTGPSNYLAGEADRVVANITAAVSQAVLDARATLPVDALWIGLAGIDRPGAREEIADRLPHLAGELRLTNDADLLFGALPAGIGVVLIAGTGSIARGKDRYGSTARAGGWGYLIGDEGSGYDLGHATVQLAARAADGRGQSTALLAALLRHWELDDPMQIIQQVNRASDRKALFASCAPLLFTTAAAGDEVARARIMEAADELAGAVQAVVARLDYAPQEEHAVPQIPLVMAGSLLVQNADYRMSVEASLRRRLPGIRVFTHAVVTEPAVAAAQSLTS